MPAIIVGTSPVWLPSNAVVIFINVNHAKLSPTCTWLLPTILDAEFMA